MEMETTAATEINKTEQPGDSLLDGGLLDSLTSFSPDEKAPKKKRKWLKRLILSSVALVLLSAGGLTAWKLLMPVKAVEETTFKEYTASQGDIRVSYEADGVVYLPFSYVDAQYSAEIKAIHVAKGDSFKEGDLLAELDDSSLVTAVDNARESVLNAQDSLRDARSSRTDAESSVKDAEAAVVTAVNAIGDAESSVADAEDAVRDAQASVEEAKKNVTSSQRNLTKQELAYQTALDNAEESASKKQTSILTQKQTIAELEEQIVQIKRDLALMEELPDEYSANEVTSKKNSLASQQIKLETEKNNLALLEKDSVDSSVTNALMSLQDAQDSLEKAKDNVTKAENNVIKAQNNVTKAQKNVETVKDNVTKAESNVEKAKANVTKVDYNIEKAQRTLDKAQDSLKEAEDNMSMAKLYAPCDGVVMAVNKAEGEIAAAVQAGMGSTSNSLIIYATENAQHTAKASIPELDIGSVSLGQIAEIEIDALDNGTFRGNVTDISNFASSGSNNVISYQATVSFDPDGEEIRDQMNCTITYITKEVLNVIKVPNDAVYKENGKSYVTVKKDDGETEERQVTTGFSDGSTCEIKSGLSAGERVVSKTVTNSKSSSNSNSESSQQANQGMPGFSITSGGGPSGGAQVFRIG